MTEHGTPIRHYETYLLPWVTSHTLFWLTAIPRCVVVKYVLQLPSGA